MFFVSSPRACVQHAPQVYAHPAANLRCCLVYLLAAIGVLETEELVCQKCHELRLVLRKAVSEHSRKFIRMHGGVDNSCLTQASNRLDMHASAQRELWEACALPCEHGVAA